MNTDEEISEWLGWISRWTCWVNGLPRPILFASVVISEDQWFNRGF